MLFDDAVQTDAAAAPTNVLMVGGKVFTGVPTAEAAGDVVAPWTDEYRRLILYGFLFPSEALGVTDVAPAQFAPYEPVTMAQLTAPGATDPIEVVDYNMVSAQVVLASVDTNVIVCLEGSHNGTDYFRLALEDDDVAGCAIAGSEATLTVDGPYVLTAFCATKFARFNFVQETASPSGATLDVKMKAKT